ncbi:MAG TPA: DUF1566 domain-containing protein, partial [Campylobacterales bacterium]|nr:DUF1566 domain-containing protein [Campylobacterales bacterium]
MLPETSRVMSENGKKLDELLEGQSHITDLRNDMNEQKEEIKKLKQEFFALRKSVQEIAPNETEIIDNANQILEEQGYESAIFYLKFQFSYLKHQQVNLSKSEEEKIVENKIDSVQIIEQVKVPPKQTTKTISKITSKTETTLTIDGLVYENIPFTKRYNWDDAKEYCAMKDGDWRLPTRKELHRLSNIEMYGQYDNGHKKWFEENKDKRFKASNGRELFVREEFLENMKNGFYFWTNETRNDSSAWVVYFY